MDLQQKSKGSMEQYHSRRRKQIYRQFLHDASEGLSFTQDVMWEMGADDISYSKANFNGLFQVSGPLAPRNRSKSRKITGAKILPCPIDPRSQKKVGDVMELSPPVLPQLETSHCNSLTARESFTLSGHRGGQMDFCKKKTGFIKASRICRYIKQAARDQEKQGRNEDEQVEFNQTAKAVTVKQKEPPKPPCLQNSLNPCAGKHVYHTENSFKQELYSGIAKQMHQQERRKADHIIMDNNSEYQKNLQEVFPCGPEKWTHSPVEKEVGRLGVNKGMGRVEKGARRWADLPTKADYALEMGLRPPDFSGQGTRLPQKQIRYNPRPELYSLHYAVEEWRNAWKINIAWKNVTTEGLKKALSDLHYHVRVAAIASCALRAVNRSQKELDGTRTAQYGQEFERELVPSELQPLLLSALSDPVKRVQMAAAVCQYAMGTPNVRAQEILQNALHQDTTGTGADSWVAAQCLAMEDEANRPVIERLLSQLFLSKTPSDQHQAASLLASISSKTTLVRSRLAEELNSANWRIRVLACHTISLLKCPTNKDLVNKLIYLMWNDWSDVVRQAAAQALGKLNMGSDVHDELRVKLDEGPPSWRVWALVLLGQLKIMTAKLLPAFLRCMNDDFVVVRKQACLTAASLMMKDKMIMDQLIELMQNDASCDVKVVAIRALGKIGCLTPTLEELLLWALHYEEVPQVRIAVCEALRILGVKGPALQNLLQERFVLEPNPVVHRHIEELIKSYGYSTEGDKGMAHMITDQIQKLCSKNIITEKVLLLEELVELEHHQRKLH